MKLEILHFYFLHNWIFFPFCNGAIIPYAIIPYAGSSNTSLPDQVVVVAPATLVLLIPPQKLSNTTKRDAGNAILNTKDASPIFSACKASIDITMLWQLWKL